MLDGMVLAMGNTIADLCALLRSVEDPDRFNRPRGYDRRVAFERFEVLTRRMNREFGSVTTARAPDGEFQGLVSLTDPAIDLVVSKFGKFVSADRDIPQPIQDVLIWELNFGVTWPLIGLDRPAPGAEAHRPLDARTPDGLRAQILALPTSPPDLANLRAWVCQELNLPFECGPFTSATYPEHQLLVEAERLKAILTADREGPEARRWLVIDDQILTSVNSLGALSAIRHEFGDDLRIAQALLRERSATLPKIRPFACAFL
jgi:hypothetical protein